MYSFELIDIDKVDISEYYNFEKKSPFTTLPWIRFLMEDNNAQPVIIRITEDNELIGYFTGLTVKKFGVKIFGSPFKGWGTCYMGYDLHDYSLIVKILEPTIKFIFTHTKCLYIELTERNLGVDKINDIKQKTEVFTTLEIDINKSDEEFFRSIKRDCRKYINQFEKRGATIEIAEPDEAFAAELYDQLCDVFAKQKLVPTYSLNKIIVFLKNLKDSGMLLCLRVRDLRGKSIASFVYYGKNEKCFGWCNGSYREFQHYRPNEYMVWHGLRILRDRGYEIFDYAGVREYKYKWNPREVQYLRVMVAKYPILIRLRNIAQETFWLLLKIKGYMKN